MNLIKFIYWKMIDIYRVIKRIIKKEPAPIHLYGLTGLFGLPGAGKTVLLTYELDKIRKRYGDKVYIATNYYYEGQDFAIESWKDLLVQRDKPLVVGYDEIQNDFQSREYKNFPVSLIGLLTQIRKGNGIKIFYTAQRYNRVDKIFRELTWYAYECKTIFGRWTRAKGYYWEDYEELNTQNVVEKKRRIRPLKKVSFIQTDKLRNMYDSYKMLKSAKDKEYITLEEQHNKYDK